MPQQDFSAWIGKKEVREEKITPWPVQAMQATLCETPAASVAEGEEMPLGWHWLYFLETKPMSEMGSDGHPKRGGFLPPVPLPRRMWAGGRLTFERALRVGESARKESEILAVTAKEGRAGPMVFVTVRHTLSASGQVAVVEEQDLVYLDMPKSSERPAGKAAPATGRLRRDMLADPVLLFRFSALTFNGHRIHYDLPYARNEEHYPDLVVHGPLQALLLLDLCGKAGMGRVKSFSFRGMSPLFCGGPFTVNAGDGKSADSLELWTADRDGNYCMTATAGFAGQ